MALMPLLCMEPPLSHLSCNEVELYSCKVFSDKCFETKRTVFYYAVHQLMHDAVSKFCFSLTEHETNRMKVKFEVV
jgi:hypothetical protein